MRPIGAALVVAAVMASVVAAAAGGASPLSQPPAAPAWLDAEPEVTATTMHLTAKAERPEPAGADGFVTLRLRVTPQAGMRIYAHDVKGYVPLTLDVAAPAGAVLRPVAYPAPVEYVFPPTGERSRVHDEPFTLVQRVRLPRGASVDDLVGTLRYQACDDRLCYKPASVRVRWAR